MLRLLLLFLAFACGDAQVVTITGGAYAANNCDAASKFEDYIESERMVGECLPRIFPQLGLSYSIIVTGCREGATQYVTYASTDCTGQSVMGETLNDVCTPLNIPNTPNAPSVKTFCNWPSQVMLLTGKEYRGNGCNPANQVGTLNQAVATVGVCVTVPTSKYGVRNSYVMTGCVSGSVSYMTYGTSDCTGPAVHVVAPKDVCTDSTIPTTTVTRSLLASCELPERAFLNSGTDYEGPDCDPAFPSTTFTNSVRVVGRCIPYLGWSYIAMPCVAGSALYLIFGTPDCTGPIAPAMGPAGVCRSWTYPGTQITQSQKLFCHNPTEPLLLSGPKYSGPSCNGAALRDTLRNQQVMVGACIPGEGNSLNSYIFMGCHKGATTFLVYDSPDCTGAYVTHVAAKDVCTDVRLPNSLLSFSQRLTCQQPPATLVWSGTEYRGSDCNPANLVSTTTQSIATVGVCVPVATSKWGVPDSFTATGCVNGGLTYTAYGSSDCTGPWTSVVAKQGACTPSTIPATTAPRSLIASCRMLFTYTQQLVPLPSLQNQLQLTTSFSVNYVYAIGMLNIANRIRITFRCDLSLPETTTFKVLNYQASNARTQVELCSAVPVTFINCNNYLTTQACTDNWFRADGPGNVTVTLTPDGSNPKPKPPKKDKEHEKEKEKGHKNKPLPKPDNRNKDNDNNRNGGGRGNNNNNRNNNRNDDNRNNNKNRNDDNRSKNNRNEKKGNKKFRADVASPEPDQIADRSSVDEAMAVEYNPAATTEDSNSAYYAFLAVIPVLAGLVGFVWWRSRRPVTDLPTFEWQGNEASVIVRENPAEDAVQVDA